MRHMIIKYDPLVGGNVRHNRAIETKVSQQCV